VLANEKTSAQKYGADYTEYELTGLVRESGEQFVTLRCPMKVDKANELLGPGGAGIYTVFVTTNYIYAIDTSVPVTMRFPERASTASAGLQVNVNVVSSKAACKNVNPYCTGSANGNGDCYCFYETSSDKLGVCKWEWGATSRENVAAAVDGLGCTVSDIPSGCESGISCSDKSCRCIYPVSGGSQDCSWTLPQHAESLVCKPFVREAQ
jgi:hypothetical protein